MRISSYSKHEPEAVNFILVSNYENLNEVVHTRLEYPAYRSSCDTGVWKVKPKSLNNG